MLIARLTAQLRCYIPEPVDEVWGRLRHLGARREQLIVEVTSQIQQIRALLECVWPAALDTARQPFRSRTWAAALGVICGRDHGDRLARVNVGVQAANLRSQVHVASADRGPETCKLPTATTGRDHWCSRQARSAGGMDDRF
ncbi:hypothetical protein [Amycolatopsis australiensis]|uniref:hypothetical protein n=1 Tax=Amycolatopsis australiensis TaxID=546364 RepID=UPI000930C780|nr:hypothetical protein [Amycolatopsis australiensis]